MPAETHNGRVIEGRKIELRQTGGAFSRDLQIAFPELLDDVDYGDEILLGVRVRMIDEHFPLADKKDPEDSGVHHALIFDTVEVVVASDRSAKALEADFKGMHTVLQKHADDAKGNETIASQLQAQHEAGEHASGLVEGCPGCDQEKNISEWEQGNGGDSAS